ncbi:RNA polymerase sporulation sigma factor SigF [Ruminiclostridium cellobioparum]|uniref:RNA polymerase sigma-F factor n=1 Tax=Ruminiclostridium cellobioparum subsp. termitidis CT1112 TaxID=1195236 RepID=S0FHW2_RUMCE|nr:RNA polymerase sporulation sigma factor SigF [Ruminiclostridium cellobioparum]EMS69586.1 RNA polymerase sigma-F factor [Ruminiclostridium cellobioparum subsp. termitidis CT1112]
MKDMTDEAVLTLIINAKAGDRQAQATLVEKNIGLVWSIVKRFQNRGYEVDDLYQIGSIGLIKAINKFDISYDVKFSTYAVPMIIGEIKRFIRDDGIIKVSRSLKEIASKARITKEIISKELGREPSVNEVAERMNVSPEELVLALEAGCTPESLYSTVGEGDNTPILLIDRINADNNSSEVDLIDKIAIRQILDSLDARERQIIILRYFKEKTQVQIAKLLGISQVQVSRIEKKILKDIKHKMIANGN